jgi:hypothetical protein
MAAVPAGDGEIREMFPALPAKSNKIREYHPIQIILFFLLRYESSPVSPAGRHVCGMTRKMWREIEREMTGDAIYLLPDAEKATTSRCKRLD